MEIDFTQCKVRSKTYGGANGKKISILYHGETYMLKFPASANLNKNMSYSNGVISEYISSHIISSLGLNVQDTLLGTYIVNGKKKVVVACKDFTSNRYQIADFASLKNSIIDSATNGYGTELGSVLDAIEQQTVVDPQELKTFFWDMFVADALIGNMDRHNGNWGFLYDPQTDTMQLAPIWDNGSSLYPQADPKLMQGMMSDSDQLLSHIYTFPNSMLKIDNRKINYFNFLSSNAVPDCSKALLKISRRIDLNKINAIIDATPFIDDLQKSFYKYMIKSRKEFIIDKAVESVKKKQMAASLPSKTASARTLISSIDSSSSKDGPDFSF